MKRFFVFLIVSFILLGCDFLQNFTESFSPVNTPFPTSTPDPSKNSTETINITATPLSPSEPASPFLPAGLPAIEPENIDNLEILAEIPVKEIYDLKISPAGTYVVTLSQNLEDRSRYMEVWNLNTGKQVYQQEKIDIPSAVFFLPDENTLVVLFYDEDPRIRNYDLSSGEIVHSLDIPFRSGALSPDGKRFAAGTILDGGESSRVTLYDFATGEEMSSLTGIGQLSRLGFSPDGKLLVTGFSSNSRFYLRIWDSESLELVKEMVDYSRPTFTLDSTLAATSKNGTIQLFDPKGWVPYGSIDTEVVYSNCRPSSFSKDGRILIFSDSYQIVYLDVETGEELFTHSDYGNGTFSPNGKIVLTWCTQCNLAIWGVSPEE